MSKKILIIDDDPVSQNMQIYALARAGYIVITASTGEDGIQTAVKESPDLIILDIMMPGMDGMDVAGFLQSDPRTARIPIIFLSSMIKGSGEKTKGENDSTSYLAKPYIKGEFLKEVEKHLSGNSHR